MKLTIRSVREEDGRYIAEIRELPGCLSYGETRTEAAAKARALALHIIADEVEHGERTGRSISDIWFVAA